MKQVLEIDLDNIVDDTEAGEIFEAVADFIHAAFPELDPSVTSRIVGPEDQ